MDQLDLTGIWYGVRDTENNVCMGLFMFRGEAERYLGQCEMPAEVVVVNLNGIVRRNTPYTGAVR